MTAHETTPSDAGIYPSQDPIELGAYYTRHVEAMTALRLHDKADIAEQLAWRDREIDRLRAREIEQGRGAVAELPPLPKPAAFCSPFNPFNTSAFAWPGTDRRAAHTDALYTEADVRAYGNACRRMGNRDE